MVKKIMISVPDDLGRWLDDHKEIQRSWVFRKAVMEIRAKMESDRKGGDSQ